MKYVVIAAVAAAFAAGGASAQEHVFKLHHLLGAQAPAQTKMLEPWVKAVEENAGGKVKIEIYPAMSLGGRPPELIQQARDGVVDIIWTVNGYTPGLFPRTEVFELPNVFENDPKAANLAMCDMFESDLADDYRGVEVMFLHVHAGQALHTRDKKVEKPEDVEGMKLRIPTRTGAWVIEAMGASPAAMPVPELPPALQKGVVDGALIPFEIIPPLKIQEQTQYQIEGADEWRFGSTTFQVSMNKARWDGLPDDVKKAFRDASSCDWWGEVGDIWRASDDFGIGMAVELGQRAHHLDAGGHRGIPPEARTRGSAMDRRSVGPGHRRRGPRREGARTDRRAQRTGGLMTAPRSRWIVVAVAVIHGWALFGGLVLCAVVAINVVSVLGGIFWQPFPGDFELTELGVAIAAFAFLPFCQLTDANVTADIFTARASHRWVAAFRLAGSLVALGFAVILLWRMYLGMGDQRDYGYTTAILQLPIWWAFVPMLISLVLLAVAALVTLLQSGVAVRYGTHIE